MKKTKCTISRWLMGLLLLGLASGAWAAPSLPITKPPVNPVPSWTGPVNDPHAQQGQWFVDRYNSSLIDSRPYEFYDNVIGSGGGMLSSNAIWGQAQNVVTDGQGNIVSFDILAQITNDTPALTPWDNGSNSHGELLQTTQQYMGTLWQTRLTASFAVPVNVVLPPPIGVYANTPPHIVAVNYDRLAWYCWTPDRPAGFGDGQPDGNYFVPTWDFGNIPIGQTAQRVLQFNVPQGLAPTDARYQAIMDSLNGNPSADLLLNRSTSLKISDWIDTLALDTGIPYPTSPLRSSDVSVFHDIPEPATAMLFALPSLLVWRRR